MVTELRQERLGLIEERDQMKALLGMDETDRIQNPYHPKMSASAKNLTRPKKPSNLFNKTPTLQKIRFSSPKQTLVVAKAKIQNLQKSDMQSKLRIGSTEKTSQPS